MTVVRKAVVATVTRAADGDLEFVLSDATKDRMGDVINPEGWDLKNFRKNPIALFNHNSQFPIGTWQKIRIDGKKLVGKLKLAALGTSERIDEIIRLVEQGVLRAVSVGFQPLEAEPLKDNSGMYFKKQELLETSLVSVPANPSAVQLARSLNTSEEVIGIVFGEQASELEAVTRGVKTGELAATPPHRKTTNMTPLSKRIEDAQERLTKLKDQLTEHLATISDEPDEASSAMTEELNTKIATHQRSLDGLKEAEARLAASAEQAELPGTVTKNVRPFATVAKKVEPREYAYRAATIKLLSHVHKASPDEIRVRHYGDDEQTKIISDFMVVKAASAPATTTTSGWASQLIQTVVADFMESLMPASAYPGLSARGLRLTFGRNGAISIPSRVATPTIAGSFVGEGSPIPVRQGAFTSISLVPKKMAVISTFTREIAEHSTPAIEGLIRNAMQEDTAVALDSVLLDATAASAIRPAGIRNGVSATGATSGGGFAALVGDIKALTGALITSTNGNVRSPVWIMNPTNALSISLTQNAGGDFPFKQEVNAGTFQGYPVIVSPTVTAGMVILVDAADFVSVTGDEPRFDVSDQATLHMEDTTPLALSAAATPNTVAAPVRSLWQTDTLGIRMILPMNWAFRRTGAIAWTESVTW